MLPYTHRAFDEDGIGSEITVRETSIAVQLLGHLGQDLGRPSTHPITTGPDAVALARAVLTDAGDTGHRVVSEEHIKDLEAAAAYVAARSMRERAAQEVLIDTHRVPMAISEAISALPLLPDEPARTPLTADTDA